MPQWPISINTLLSVLALILKVSQLFIVASCLGQRQWKWFQKPTGRPLFDMVRYRSASDGAFGSLRYLNPLRLHISWPPALNLLAVLITILSTAIGPFVQQIVAHVDCSQPSGATNASLPRTNLIGNFYNDFVVQLNAPVTAAFYVPVPQFTNFDCASGNCTFPGKYSTVGFCSRCEDITQHLIYTEDCFSQESNVKSVTPMERCQTAWNMKYSPSLQHTIVHRPIQSVDEFDAGYHNPLGCQLR